MDPVFTKEFIKDEDIDVNKIKSLMDDICEKMKSANKYNLTDINVISEEIFGQLINLLYGYNLKSMSATVSGNFAAVDLIDNKNKVAYQVTSQYDRRKVNHTLDEFEKNKNLFQQINEIYILVLGNEPHNFNSPTIRLLENGQIFDFKKDVINLYGLLKIISDKAKTQSDLLVRVYDILMMVYESGRLEYLNVVEETSQLKVDYQADSCQSYFLKIGMGDVCVSAFLPLSYGGKLSCRVEMRKYDIRGVCITIDQDDLINNYFVDEEVFKDKHVVGRCVEDEQVWFKMNHIRFLLNAHSAYRLYLIFSDINKKYQEQMDKIYCDLGCSKLRMINGEFLVCKITLKQRDAILLFAEEHNWGFETGEINWNIFNDYRAFDQIQISPNMSSHDKGQIWAIFNFVRVNDKIDEYKVLWEPGKFTEAKETKFDNITRWTGDYSMEWFEKLLKKVNEQNEIIELSHKTKRFGDRLKGFLESFAHRTGH